MSVTILGGTGLLGGHVARELRRDGIDFTLAGRSADGPGTIRVDLASGAGLEQAIEPADTVMHLASSFRNPVDVDVRGTEHLLPLLGDRHLIYISIVGVDRHPLDYYKAKHQVERMIEQSASRYSILRTTQFHDFVAYLVARMCKWPICWVPMGHMYQPVDIVEVARHLTDIAEGKPSGMLPDCAGPEVIGIVTLARTYMTAIGRERPIVPVPKPGKAARAYRRGLHTNRDRAVGHKTWARYLGERFLNEIL